MTVCRILIPLQKFPGSLPAPEDGQIIHLFKKIGNNLFLEDPKFVPLIPIAKIYTVLLPYLQ